MTKKPVTIPTSLFIFKNITCKGFWLNKYFLDNPLQTRLDIYKELFDLARDGIVDAVPGKDISFGRIDSSDSEDLDLIDKITRVSRMKKYLVSNDFHE
jgi:mitochondrial enoyl-[acyl-carrier protein] reductase / trans-2-enoyl-CoA reductase